MGGARPHCVWQAGRLQMPARRARSFLVAGPDAQCRKLLCSCLPVSPKSPSQCRLGLCRWGACATAFPCLSIAQIWVTKQLADGAGRALDWPCKGSCTSAMASDRPLEGALCALEGGASPISALRASAESVAVFETVLGRQNVERPHVAALD